MAHLARRDDGLVTAAALGEEVGDWGAFLAGGLRERDAGFLAELEQRLGRRLRPGKRGRKADAVVAAEVN